jgi:hypothetical protein
MYDSLTGHLPAFVSQLLWGGIGDFLMYALTLAVVMNFLSSQIVSITSIFMYDIYQTYIDKAAPPASKTTTVVTKRDGASSVEHFKNNETVGAPSHDRRLKFVKFVATMLTSLAIFIAALVMLQLQVSLSWLFKLTGIIAGSSVIPVFLSISWHRTTGIGVFMGAILGLFSGIIGWLVYASTFDGGLTYINTGRPLVFIVGVTVSLGGGGLVCLLFSLGCGGCRSTLLEDDVWEKTAQIDSIVTPWAERYAAFIDSVNILTKRPHFFQVFQFISVEFYEQAGVARTVSHVKRCSH